MRPALRYLPLVLVLAATAASAQSSPSANPLSRSEHDSFYYGALQSEPRSVGGSLSGTQISRPIARFGPPVTPVPEPSDWSMMLVGLAFVGWIVRRRSKGS